MDIPVMQDILGRNDEIAGKNKSLFDKHGILAINLLGSPGSGKTTLLERTIAHLKNDLRLAVIEGDLFTDKDADRIAQHSVQMSVQGAARLLCFIEQIIFEYLYFSPICIQVSIDFFFIVFAVWLGLDCMTRPIPDAFPSPIFLSVGTIQCLTDAVTSRTLLIC